jgi:hypothetical protein
LLLGVAAEVPVAIGADIYPHGLTIALEVAGDCRQGTEPFLLAHDPHRGLSLVPASGFDGTERRRYGLRLNPLHREVSFVE